MLAISGCVTVQKMDVRSNYCELTNPLYFDNKGTVDWLLANDKGFLESVVAHNNAHDRICVENSDEK